MGKITKHSNIYSTTGELIRKAPIKAYTIAELEELVDKLEPNTTAYNNAMMILTQLYQKDPKAQLEVLKQLQSHYTTNTEVKEALHDVLPDLDMGERMEDNTKGA